MEERPKPRLPFGFEQPLDGKKKTVAATRPPNVGKLDALERRGSAPHYAGPQSEAALSLGLEALLRGAALDKRIETGQSFQPGRTVYNVNLGAGPFLEYRVQLTAKGADLVDHEKILFHLFDRPTVASASAGAEPLATGPGFVLFPDAGKFNVKSKARERLLIEVQEEALPEAITKGFEGHELKLEESGNDMFKMDKPSEDSGGLFGFGNELPQISRVKAAVEAPLVLEDASAGEDLDDDPDVDPASKAAAPGKRKWARSEAKIDRELAQLQKIPRA